jgi:hypothetical protein
MTTTIKHTQLSNADQVERVSLLSSLGQAKDTANAADGYVVAKTPLDLEGGALRPGGAPDLFGRECFGLLAQYAAVGMVFGTLPGVVYPFLTQYLNMEGTQTASARVLVTLPWSFKVVYGVISDCFPICGYRRRPYMLLGWGVSFVMLLAMACMSPGPPYYPDRKYATMKPADITPAIRATFNESSRDKGGVFIILMMLTAVGYVGADVAADAVVCELAQREPEAVRGRTQTAIYTTRTVFVIVSQVLSGFFFNGVAYGGDYSFSLSFPQLMLVLAIFLLPILPLTWYFISEEKSAGVPLRKYLGDLWALLQTRVMYQVIAYQFFAGLLDKMVWVAADPVAAYWIRVTNLNDKLQAIASNAVFAVTLALTAKYGLHWNWRSMTAITMVAVVVLDAIVTMLGVWDVVRSQWFWLGVPVVEHIPSSINFIIGTYVIVELAGDGNEAAVYGLVSTVANLALPLASTISKNLNSCFAVTNTDIQTDSTHVRWAVTATIAISYAGKLLSLCLLPLLPPQKAQTQELLRTGGSSKWMGLLTLAYVLFALVWSILTNVLSIFPTTKCLRIAGGRGCSKTPKAA